MRFIVALAALAFAAGCAGKPGEDRANLPRVIVSIPPQAWFAERIAGGRVAVEILVEPGQSPHSFEPTARKIASLGAGSAWLTCGMPFEDALLGKPGTALTKLRRFDAGAGIELLDSSDTGAGCDCGHESHEEHDGHGRGRKDPHFWLDPSRAAQMARNIASALKEIDPGGSGEFEKNLEALVSELSAAEKRISEKLAPFKGAEVFVFHPAFGYFTARFNLKQVSVETEGKEPGPKALAALIDRARERGARVVFVQPQFPAGSARAVAEAIGGSVVPMDPLSIDYMANLDAMAQAVAGALGDR